MAKTKESKEFGAKQTKALVCLLGLTLAYQAAYQLLVLNQIPEHEKPQLWSPCWNAQIEEQQDGVPSSSDRECAKELELFRSWRTLPYNDLSVRPVGALNETSEAETEPGSGVAVTAAVVAGEEKELAAVDPIGRILFAEKSDERASNLNDDFEDEQDEPDSESESESDSELADQEHEVVDPEARSEINSASPSGDTVETLSVSTLAPEDAASSNDVLVAEVAKDPLWENSTVTGLTAWAKGLVALQEQLEARMGALRSVRRASTLKNASGPGLAQERTLLQKIEDFQRELCADPRRKDRPSCARFAPKLVSSAEWIASLEATQAKLEARMEAFRARQQRSRQKFENATKPKTGIEALNSKLAAIGRKRNEWEQALTERAQSLGKELCRDPSRRGYAACKQFLMADVPTSSPERILSLTQPAAPLGSKANSFLGRRQNGPLIIEKNDVRGKKWQARIPKVACIMAVPNTTAAAWRLKYVVNNFLAQSYEGPKQLILVYHYQSSRIAQLMQRFADGHYIKAVAARTDVPSTTSLRFGAWAADADADVLAHWDFDAWHHPERLAMQVRTLGLTGRSACLLKKWKAVSDGNERVTKEEGLGLSTSMVGQRAWMERNWYPLLEGEDARLRQAKGQLAQLDMAELMVAYSPSPVSP